MTCSASSASRRCACPPWAAASTRTMPTSSVWRLRAATRPACSPLEQTSPRVGEASGRSEGAEHVHGEHERLVLLDPSFRATCLAVPGGRRDHEQNSAAGLHTCQPFDPALDDLGVIESERDRLLPIPRGGELLARAPRSAEE